MKNRRFQSEEDETEERESLLRTHVVWAESDVHRRLCTEHFLTAGASGSGKTTLINLLMQSVFPDPVSGLVYDPKPEFLPLLFDLKNDTEQSILEGTSKVKVLNPLDVRCCAWDMAKDITGLISARQVASILVPDSESKGSSEGFFTDAVRDLLAGVMLAFIECAPNEGSWTFRDIVLTMLYEPYLRFILSIPETRNKLPFLTSNRLLNSYLDGDQRTVSNIRATINTKISLYEPIAAMWEYALSQSENRKFSIVDWALGQTREVLVLGNDESSRFSIDALNRAIFKRASECLLSREEQTQAQKDSGSEQVWVVLDEVREAGKLDGLSSIMTKGRSKGVCAVLGFQDINGLRATYGEEVANEIVAQCNNFAILRLNSPETAQWASDLFGKRKLETGSGGITFGQTTQFNSGTTEQELPYLFTADFLYLPTPGTSRGVNGFLKDPGIDPEKNFSDIKFTVSTQIKPIKNTKGNFAAYNKCKNESLFYLKPWDTADWKRLGFMGDVPSWKNAEEPDNAPPISDEKKQEAKETADRTLTLYEALMGVLKQVAGSGTPRPVKKGDPNEYNRERNS